MPEQEKTINNAGKSTNADSCQLDTVVSPQQIPCDQCQGEGRICIGEHLVTLDMAIDAGDRRLEGTHCEYEYAQCGKCEGDGWVAG